VDQDGEGQAFATYPLPKRPTWARQRLVDGRSRAFVRRNLGGQGGRSGLVSEGRGHGLKLGRGSSL